MELDLSTLSVEDEDLDDGPEELEAIKNTPALFKAYFDDPAMSGITVKLSDRSLHLHRIVLCRASEYFSSLLTKNFKESDSKEVELHEDDPEAMTAVLRHLYGLPYAADLAEWHNGYTLLPHVLVFTTAEKYQIPSLKIDSLANIKNILHHHRGNDERTRGWVVSSDCLGALRQIYAGTATSDTEIRSLLVAQCVVWSDRMRALVNNNASMQLISEVPGLGADFIAQFYTDGASTSRSEFDYCDVCRDMTPINCLLCSQGRS